MRVLSFILLSLTAGLTLAIPTANSDVEKRQLSSVSGILSTLTGATGGILPELGSLSSSGTASDSTVAPLLTSLVGSLTSAGSSLSSVASSGGTSDISASAAASAVSGVISSISTSLSGLAPFANDIPVFGPLVGSIDVALNGILIGLSTIITSVLILIASALADVEVILGTLGFTLILSTLGI